jgi:hypothetical protein
MNGQYQCDCDDGFAGRDCSLRQSVCAEALDYSPDNAKVCLNGGVCEAFHMLNGTAGMRCNCQPAAGELAYAGPQCEEPTTDVCEEGRTTSEYAFCVNGGTCVRKVPPGEPHPFCHCLDGYEGRHCQYQQGFAAAPMEELIYVASGGYGKLVKERPEKPIEKPAVKFGVIMAGFTFFGAIAIVVYRFRKRRASKAQRPSDDEDMPIQTPRSDDDGTFI